MAVVVELSNSWIHASFPHERDKELYGFRDLRCFVQVPPHLNRKNAGSIPDESIHGQNEKEDLSYRLARYVVWAKNWGAPTNRPWSECTATGYPPDRPLWLAVWLFIIADNLCHVVLNGLALHYL